MSCPHHSSPVVTKRRSESVKIILTTVKNKGSDPLFFPTSVRHPSCWIPDFLSFRSPRLALPKILDGLLPNWCHLPFCQFHPLAQGSVKDSFFETFSQFVEGRICDNGPENPIILS